MHNLHPGCKFAPECIFGHVNGVLRICTRVLICTGCKCAPIFEVQFVHMNAKSLISIRFDWEY